MLRPLVTFVLMAVILYLAVGFFREEVTLLHPSEVLDWKAFVFYAVALNLYALVNLPYLRVAGAKLRLFTGKATDEEALWRTQGPGFGHRKNSRMASTTYCAWASVSSG